VGEEVCVFTLLSSLKIGVLKNANLLHLTEENLVEDTVASWLNVLLSGLSGLGFSPG